MKDNKRVYNAILKIKDDIIGIIKTQNSILECIIDCQERIKKLEQKNG
tara:strand:+ start:324 stop:467 length:144 start_codon:yes stop_codon:yes gene_type:complete